MNECPTASASRGLVFRLSVLMFLQWAVPGALVPLYSVHLEKLGFGPLTVAVCCAAQSAAAIVSSLLTGQIADRWMSAERAMALCALLAGAALWLLAGLEHPVAVFVVTLLFWLVTGPMLLLGTTIGFTHLPAPDRQFGPVRLWGTVGWMAVGWLTGWWLGAAATVPLPDAFRLGAGIAFSLAAYTLTLPHTPPRPAVGPGRRFAPAQALRMLRRPAFAVYCFCLLGACVTFPFSTQNTPLLIARLGVPPERLALVLTLAQTTEVLSLAILPALLQRLSLRGTMTLGLAAWLTANTILAVGRPVELVVASLLLNGLYVTCFLIAGQVYVNARAADDLRASAQGLSGCISGMGLLTGNLLAGGLRQHYGGEPAPTFVVAAAITALLLLVYRLGFRDTEATQGPVV